MMLAAALLSGIVQAPPITHLSHGVGHVGSRPDPGALGGYGSSDNAPRPLGTFKAPGVMLHLELKGRNLIVNILNGKRSELKVRAADSGLPMWLEAKTDRQPFRFITYRMQATCGNSYHHVFLPAGQRWEVTKGEFGMGPLKAKVRAKLILEDDTLYSNEVEMSLPSTIFKLPSEMPYPGTLDSDGYYKFSTFPIIDPIR